MVLVHVPVCISSYSFETKKRNNRKRSMMLFLLSVFSSKAGRQKFLMSRKLWCEHAAPAGMVVRLMCVLKLSRGEHAVETEDLEVHGGLLDV